MEDTETISLGSVSVKGTEDDPVDSVWRMIDISFRAV